ncbi:hypothetical protein [Croceibacter atlanticus]|uniref:hypothetical protein n=1 Tax=Croceibacter atlanticus TaxID=313588 RepID=UPI0030DBD1F7|tara:strand:+ start:65792 stop:66220 length:429 start_codon:yes stop_codon:yes gene_type:complete
MNQKTNNDQDRLKELQNDLILHFHQDATFYERRTYIIFFVISGFGLFSCLDLYDRIKTTELIILTMISASLFILPLLLTIVSNEMARKKNMYKAEYFQNFRNDDNKGARNYIKIENGLKLTIGFCQLIGVILIGITYYKCIA